MLENHLKNIFFLRGHVSAGYRRNAEKATQPTVFNDSLIDFFLWFR